jgi:Zinc finger, C2H2 type
MSGPGTAENEDPAPVGPEEPAASPPGSLRCRECDLWFPTDPALMAHYKTHGKPFACALCGARFTRKFHMQRHVRVRHARRQARIRCSECARTFATDEGLKAHAACHSLDRAKGWRCPVAGCPHASFRKADLKKHMLLHERHFGEDEKAAPGASGAPGAPRLRCAQGCGREFCDAAALERHACAGPPQDPCTLAEEVEALHRDAAGHAKLHLIGANLVALHRL